MVESSDLGAIRRAYAKQILAEAEVDDPRLEAAFAMVPREDFLGPGILAPPPTRCLFGRRGVCRFCGRGGGNFRMCQSAGCGHRGLLLITDRSFI